MGQRYCDHEFVCINPVDYTYAQPKAEVACVYCGQIRHITPLGDVTIFVEEGRIIKKRNDNPTTDQKV